MYYAFHKYLVEQLEQAKPGDFGAVLKEAERIAASGNWKILQIQAPSIVLERFFSSLKFQHEELCFVYFHIPIICNNNILEDSIVLVCR